MLAELIADLDSIFNWNGNPVGVIWYDQNIIAGQKWWNEITANILDCTIFVPALSRNYFESEPCKIEAEYARALNKHFMPIRIRDDFDQIITPIDDSLVHYIDYVKSDKKAYKDLRKAALLYQTSNLLPEILPAVPQAPIKSMFARAENLLKQSVLEANSQRLIISQLIDFFKGVSSDEEHDKALKLIHILRERDDVVHSVYLEIGNFLNIKDYPVTLSESNMIEEEDIIFQVFKRVVYNQHKFTVGQFMFSIDCKFGNSIELRMVVQSLETIDQALAAKIRRFGWLKSESSIMKFWPVGYPIDNLPYVSHEESIEEVINRVEHTELREIAKEVIKVYQILGIDIIGANTEQYQDVIAKVTSVDDIPF